MKKLCSNCDGAGKVSVSVKCPHCNSERDIILHDNRVRIFNALVWLFNQYYYGEFQNHKWINQLMKEQTTRKVKNIKALVEKIESYKR